MKIRIEGTEYELFESVGGASLGDLLILKKDLGVTVNSIKAMFDRMEKTLKKKGATPFDLLEDDLFFDNMIGVIYLSRRKRGEALTVEDASAVSFQDVQLVLEESDLDPKEVGGRAPSTSTT